MADETRIETGASDVEVTDSWFEVGMDADMSPEYSGSKTMRFFIPAGKDAKILFLNDEPCVFYEHNLKYNGHWRNWFTCLESPDGKGFCPICKYARETKNFARAKVAAFTIIDLNKWTDKSGKEHVNEKKLFVAKAATVERLKRKHQARVAAGGTGLRGCILHAFRSTKDKSPSVGDDFEMVGLANLSDYPDTTPFNYKEVFKPDPETVKKVMATITGGGGKMDDTTVKY